METARTRDGPLSGMVMTLVSRFGGPVMTWHTVVAATDEFRRLLGDARIAGGVITRSRPCVAGLLII